MKHRKHMPNINITPLVDVLIILLVIMMIAMPMFVKKLPVSLPKTDISGAPLVTRSITIAIDNNGSMTLDGGPISMSTLLVRVNPQTIVEIAADSKVPYEKIANIISAIQKKNPKDIALLVN